MSSLGEPRPERMTRTPCRDIPVSISRCTGTLARAHSTPGGRFLQEIQMVWLPNHGGEPVLEHRIGFAGPESRHQKNARLRANGAYRNAFLGACDAQPFGARASQERRTRKHAVPIGVRFHHGQEPGARGRGLPQLLVVGEQALAGDFNPQGTIRHSRLYRGSYPRFRAGNAESRARRASFRAAPQARSR